jgi:competence protein ComEA
MSVDPPATSESDTVHVSGAVVAPGLVIVPGGSRVADAIRAAGGALPSADLGALNLAAPVGDGERLIVPAAGGPDAAPPSVSGAGPLSLNRATAAELEELPGVGPVLAERIIAHRERIGGFSSVEDLLDVSGIGERTLAEIRDRVTAP